MTGRQASALHKNQVGFNLKIDSGDRKESGYGSPVSQHWITDSIWGQRMTQNFPAGRDGETGVELKKTGKARENTDMKTIKQLTFPFLRSDA